MQSTAQTTTVTIWTLKAIYGPQEGTILFDKLRQQGSNGVSIDTLIKDMILRYTSEDGEKPSQKLLAMGGKAAKLLGTGFREAFDTAVAGRFPGAYVKGEASAQQLGMPKTTLPWGGYSKTFPGFVLEQTYTLAELTGQKVINGENSRLLATTRAFASIYGATALPGMSWVMLLARRGLFDALARLGFAFDGQPDVILGNGNLDKILEKCAAAKVSDIERGLLDELATRGWSDTSPLVECFYRKGKPFMAYPAMTLGFLVANVTSVDGRSVNSPAREGYVARLTTALTKYYAVWLGNAGVHARESLKSMPTTSPGDVATYLSNISSARLSR